MSRKKEKTSTEPPSPAKQNEQEKSLDDATVAFRALVSSLNRANAKVHLGYDSGGTAPVMRDKAGNFAITIAGAHIEQRADGPVIVADKSEETKKTPL